MKSGGILRRNSEYPPTTRTVEVHQEKSCAKKKWMYAKGQMFLVASKEEGSDEVGRNAGNGGVFGSRLQMNVLEKPASSF